MRLPPRAGLNESHRPGHLSTAATCPPAALTPCGHVPHALDAWPCRVALLHEVQSRLLEAAPRLASDVAQAKGSYGCGSGEEL